MRLFLHLAWRNLWRNKRRTIISTSSVFFAVLLSLIMRSMQNGTYDYMIQSSVELYSGYLQIHGKDYWEKRSIDQSIIIQSGELESYSSLPNITHCVPRIESFVLISRNTSTRVTQIVGIDPSRENAMTGLSKRIESGRYLHNNDKGILIGSGLAKFLDVTCGDSVIVYGQGFHGVTAAASIPVVGILNFPIPVLNNAMSYITIEYAQWLFDAPGRVTSIAFMISSQNQLSDIQSQLKQVAGKNTEVMTWKEMMPELVQSIQVDSAGGIIMLLILYIVIGFGIFGTIMMMTNERIREFGILISVGMKRWKLISIAVIETILISLIGAGAGIVTGIPILWYLYSNPIPLTGDTASAMLAYGLEPIIPFSIDPAIFIAQTSTVFILAVICAVYPFLVIKKLKPVAAIRS